MDSLGFIELPNLADAIEALDVMVKTADVTFLAWEAKLGGRLVTIIIQGDIAAVSEALEAAKARAKGKIVASAVIGNPHPETMKMALRSAQKENKTAEG